LAGKGVADKETGSYASNIRPKNIEEAIDKMRGINITIRLYLGALLGHYPSDWLIPHYGEDLVP
jgi:hypothetical protein